MLPPQWARRIRAAADQGRRNYRFSLAAPPFPHPVKVVDPLDSLEIDVVMPDPAFIVERRDALVGIVLTVSGLFLLINLVMDLLYAVLDPRIARS